MTAQIRYASANGYTGVLYGKSSLSVYGPDGKEVLHTGARNVNTLEELKHVVEGMQEFVRMCNELIHDRDGED